MFSLKKKVEGKEEKQDVKILDIEDDYREQARIPEALQLVNVLR